MSQVGIIGSYFFSYRNVKTRQKTKHKIKNNWASNKV